MALGRSAALCWAACAPLVLTCAGAPAVKTMQPPGCECTLAQCCADPPQGDCTLFDAHLSSTLPGRNRTALCEQQRSGTLNGSLTVCDYLLQEPEFGDRFIDGNSASVWLEVVEDATCAELQASLGSCPPAKAADEPTIWSWGISSGCSKVIFSAGNGTSRLVSSRNCSSNKQGELNILAGFYAPDAADELDTCPASPTLTFSSATTNGVESRRWVCHDASFLDSQSTTWRLLYVNLGDLPCGGGGSLPGDSSPAETNTDGSQALRWSAGLVLASFIGSLCSALLA